MSDTSMAEMSSGGGLKTTAIPWWPQKVTKPGGSCEPQEVSGSYSSVAEGSGFVTVW